MLGFFSSTPEVVLNLSGVDLADLPADIAANVTAIVARDNRIVALPATLRTLTLLTRLDLDNNLLRHLPSCIYHMGTLLHLSLRNNHLTKLEPEIVHLARLKTLALEGNPLAFPPIKLAQSMKLARLFEWIQKNPSYTAFRLYYNRHGEAASFVDFNIGTAHAQVKEGKKNEDRWDNCVMLDAKGLSEDDREVRVKHVDLDDPSLHFRQGNTRPNKSSLNVYRGQSVFIGMYDGHGGNAASGALQQNMLKLAKKGGLLAVSADDDAFDWDTALKNLFLDVDAKLCDALVGLKKGAGSTCTVCIIVSGATKMKLIVAHVGDSRAVAALSAPPGFVELTKDHSPSDEQEKLACEARGGKVARKKPDACLRVNGDLNMTRSMGDVKWKRPVGIISCLPDVKVITLDTSYQSLIVASDGLWCYMNSEMASNYSKNEETAEAGARVMVAKIKDWIEGTRHKGDNTSVTVVNFAWHAEPSPAAAEIILSE